MSQQPNPFPCGRTRRSFLADTALGFTGLAAGAMLHRDGIARGDETAARNVIDGKASDT